MAYWTATWFLMLKNLRLLWRSPGPLIIVVVASFVSLLIMFLMQASFDRGDGLPDWLLETKDPEPFSLETIPRCIPSVFSDCITLAYVPSDNSTVKGWVDAVAKASDIPANETRGFATSKELNDYLVENPNRTQAAYVFEKYSFDEIAANQASFIVQYNLTDQKVFPIGFSVYNAEVVVPAMIHNMNKVLRPVVAGSYAPVNINMKANTFPHPKLFAGENAFLQIGPFMIFSVYFLVLVTFLSKMTEEKEKGLRDAMRLAGMSQSQHFISWGFPLLALNFVVTFGLIAFGHAFRFRFFRFTAFGVYFLTFFVFSLALFGWTFFLAAFMKKTRTVSSAGFMLFIFMYILAIFGGIVYTDRDNGLPLISEKSLYWREIMAIFPSTMFIRCIGNIAIVTAQDFPLSWKDAVNNPRTYSTRTCWLWMLGSGAVTFLLSIYLDNVLPTPHGSPLSPIYFLKLSYWKTVLGLRKPRPASTTTTPDASESGTLTRGFSTEPLINPADSIGYDPQEEDPAVQREREKVASGDRDADPLVIKNIVRRFKKLTAVDDVSLSVGRNTAFACLGHNGAGKSTLFKMLVTSIGVTSGDAFIYGRSVQDAQAETRGMLGVCQQHDALWDHLSGTEHIEVFAALKGLPRPERESEMTERLLDVGLDEFSERYAGAYSGGMQRRLSVAISLTGNPRILLLDEFSTGADPLVKRDLWATIERAKKNRVVFIITHSMAEAERLGDNIGIMSQGKLRVLGTSLYLKNKFGAGYRLVVKLSSANGESLAAKLSEVCPGLILIEETAVQNSDQAVLAQYSLPRRSSDDNVLNVTKLLEEKKEELGVLEFSLDSASLDQVFKSITSLSADDVEPDFKEERKCLPCFGSRGAR